MEVLYSIEHKLLELCKEINAKPSLGWSDVEKLNPILDDLEHIVTISTMVEYGGGYSGEMSNGYSGEHYVRGHYSRGYGDYSGDRNYGYSGNRYSNGMEHDGMYMSGRSYGDYSGYRDSRGRYSRDDMMERTKSQIERLMNESQNEEVREALQGALQRLH